ncbi:hypothetical protein CASFOL_011585 [Castilleja foliolosa]|uniref:Uncharacterized protein n=1 Tax=Castilleja foliolosa TaxID=1961234 RepID=A0ABD3DZV9_9LAMI
MSGPRRRSASGLLLANQHERKQIMLKAGAAIDKKTMKHPKLLSGRVAWDIELQKLIGATVEKLKNKGWLRNGFPRSYREVPEHMIKYLLNEEKMELLNEEQMEFDNPYGNLKKIRPAFKYLYAMKMLNFGIRGEKVFMEIPEHKGVSAPTASVSCVKERTSLSGRATQASLNPEILGPWDV